MGVQAPVTLQQQYNLVYREVEYEVIPAALHNGIGILPWSPLAAGFLSGKYARDDEANSDGRLVGANPMNQHMGKQLFRDDRKWATLDAVKTIAGQVNATPSQVALSWLMQQPAVTAPILGCRTMAQLRDNLGAAKLALDADMIGKMNTASTPTPDDYPYGRFGVLQRERYIDSSEQALREL